MQLVRLAAPLLAALIVAADAPATTTWSPRAEFRLTVAAGDNPEVDLSLDLPGGAQRPGRIDVYEPRGFTIHPERPPGAVVGTVFITAANEAFGTPTYSTLSGDVVVQDPAPQPGCAVPAPIALWQIQLSLLGQPYDVPLVLGGPSPADPAPAAGSIVLCVPSLPAGGAALPIRTFDLSLVEVRPPTRRGTYVWRTIVTPTADGITLRPEAAYELRAMLPVPHRLTLAGARVRDTHLVQLHGRLTADGVPRAGVSIRVVRLVRSVTPDGVSVDDAVLGWARTNRRGAYSFRAHAPRTATFLTLAEPTSAPCQGPSVAPAGCLSATLPAAQSDALTVG